MMNEQICQLLAQAHLEVDDVKDTNKIAERFAKLIVQECIAVAKEEEDRYDSLVSELGDDAAMCANAMTEYQLAIKEHFGVSDERTD